MSYEGQERYERLFKDAVNNARFDRGKSYASIEETADLIGFEAEDLNDLIGAVLELTKEMVSRAIDAGHLDPNDSSSMYDAICANTTATTLILLNAITKQKKGKTKTASEDMLPVTLLAEAHIRNLIADQADLSTVWPLPLAEDVAKEFEPAHAFMVGVVCGASNG